MKEIVLQMLPSGHIRVNRGDAEHNKNLREILIKFLNGDEDVINKIDEFLSGSEDSEILIGDKLFCG